MTIVLLLSSLRGGLVFLRLSRLRFVVLLMTLRWWDCVRVGRSLRLCMLRSRVSWNPALLASRRSVAIEELEPGD
jgi:hypothetical protein